MYYKQYLLSSYIYAPRHKITRHHSELPWSCICFKSSSYFLYPFKTHADCWCV